MIALIKLLSLFNTIANIVQIGLFCRHICCSPKTQIVLSKTRTVLEPKIVKGTEIAVSILESSKRRWSQEKNCKQADNCHCNPCRCDPCECKDKSET